MSGSLTLFYTDADFRTQFPAFADTVAFPQSLLQTYFTIGTDYVSNQLDWSMQQATRQFALYLLTAHMIALAGAIAANAGSSPGIMTEATIDKVHISVQPPSAKNGFQYWLNQTPYGIQLRALLAAVAAGGFYMSGRPQLNGFRRGYGAFG